jgi:hypothetical protein
VKTVLLGSPRVVSIRSHSEISLVVTQLNGREVRWKRRWKTTLQSVRVPRNVEFLCSPNFSDWRSLSSIIFDSASRLKRIEPRPFWALSFQSIVSRRRSEILHWSCLSPCWLSGSADLGTLSSITLELDRRLTWIESIAVAQTAFQSIIVHERLNFFVMLFFNLKFTFINHIWIGFQIAKNWIRICSLSSI